MQAEDKYQKAYNFLDDLIAWRYPGPAAELNKWCLGCQSPITCDQKEQKQNDCSCWNILPINLHFCSKKCFDAFNLELTQAADAPVVSGIKTFPITKKWMFFRKK
jgi:hypothetical protein